MGVCHARFRVRRVYSSEYKESPLVQGEAVPRAKLFIRAMSSAIASTPANGQVTLSRELREEISH